MTTEQYTFCLSEVKNYTDRDAYISDLSLSSIWCDAPEHDIPADRLTAIGQIWDAVHRTAKDIVRDSGHTMASLSKRFGIPYRTLQNWCSGVRVAPDYVLMMMQECLGMLPDIKQ